MDFHIGHQIGIGSPYHPHMHAAPPLPPTTPSEQRTTRWIWWLPRLAFALFIVAVTGVLWHSERTSREEQRATLLSDVLWLEQNLQFQLTHNEDLLARLDPEHWRTAALFSAHASALIGNHSGLQRLTWLNAEGRAIYSTTPLSVQSDIANPQAKLAASMARAVYSTPYPTGNDEWVFEVSVPLFPNGKYLGTAVGIYALNRLLEESVPWWLTERYRIELLDANGRVLAQRSKVVPIETGLEYQIPLDPPGQGLLLRASPYHQPTPLAGRLLSASLVVLAVAVLFSLWAVRRHVQRRLAAESALQEEFAFRSAMENSVQTGLRARDLEGRVTYVNPAFCRMVGWPAEELVGRKPPMPYWSDEYLAQTEAMHRRVLSGESPSDGFEMRFRRRDGELFDALIHEAPLIDAQGRHTGWMGSVVDITERKRAQESARQHAERLQASARLVTMGEMASSLAHELNQPLAAISSYLGGCRTLLASGSAAPAELDGALEKCQSQAQRAGRIIRRIYEFVRRHEPKSEACDLDILFTDLVSLLEPESRRLGVALAVTPAPTCADQPMPIILGDRVLLSQALLNLMKNGIEAMRLTPPEHRQLAIRVGWDETQIRITVTDQGCGVSSEAAAHLFEPFYTTKSEGLGVGLNICRSVIEAHQGRLWHEPNPGGGSSFHILLPYRRPPAA